MARGFALLRMPKMPELKGKNIPGFTRTEVDTDTIRYKDKNRERQRQKMLIELMEKRVTAPPKRNYIKNKPWSKQKTKNQRRKKRSAKRKLEEVFVIFKSAEETSDVWVYSRLLIVFVPCLQGSDVEDEDMKELLKDTRILKRLKKGQITEEDFEEQITSGINTKHSAGGASSSCVAFN